MNDTLKRTIFRILSIVPDKLYLSMMFYVKMKRRINWDDPQTFNEKLQWLKLYGRKPEYTQMVDKYEAKKYVSERIGDQYIIPTLGVWDRFEDIDFERLPNQFVLKCTHDSGGLVICKDKSKFDKERARKKIRGCLNTNYYYSGREWPYKNVKPRIIAESYIEDVSKAELRDYKIFAFNGKARAMYVASDRANEAEETKFDFFDAEFRHLPFTNAHPNSAVQPTKPDRFEEMLRLAEQLSENIPHLRVDFYEVNGKVYFGELTFSHMSGMKPFVPSEWDKIFGDWIILPKDTDDHGE